MTIKSNFITIGGALLALVLIVDIARSLSRPGPSCDDCGGALDVIGRISEAATPITYYRCRDCSRYLALPDPLHAPTQLHPGTIPAAAGDSE